MTTYPSYWAVDANGAWSSDGDWWTYVPNSNPPPNYNPWHSFIPGADDDVSLTPTSEPSGNSEGTSPFTINYNFTDTIASLSGPSYATLLIKGNKLTVINSLNLAGALDISGGTLDVENTGGSTSYEGSQGANYVLLPALDLTGGTLEIDAGAFGLVGNDVIAGGVVSGAGDFYVTGAGELTIDEGAKITAATFELGVTGNGTTSLTTLNTNFSYSGNFLIDDYSGNNATLDLNGFTLTLSGTTSISGTINGPGTLVLTSADTATFSPPNYSGFDALGGVNVINQGSITEIDNFQLDGTLDNQATGLFDITTNNGITNEGSVAVTNEGTIEKTQATGRAFIQGSFTTTGTVDVVTGEISVIGSGGTLSGSIEGAGVFTLEGGGVYILSAALSLTVATLGIDTADGNGGGSVEVELSASFSYAGAFEVGSQFDDTDIDLEGYTLTLTSSGAFTGPYGSVNLIGGGSLVLAAGSTSSMDGTNIASGVTIENAGAFSSNGDIYLDSDGGSTQTLFQNDSQGVVVLGGAPNEFSENGTSGLITNAGEFEKTTGTGDSDIRVAFDTTGTLYANSGSIWLYDGGSIGGTLSGAGDITLRGSAGYTLAANVSIQVANWSIYDSTTVTFSANLTYAASFYEGGQFSSSTLDLAGYTFTLTDAATFTAPYGAVYLKGGGGVGIASGATASIDSTDLASGMTITNSGTVNANNNIDLDYDGGSSQSLFSNTSSGVVDLADSGTVFEQGGSSGLIANAGLFDKVASTGQSDVYVAFNNTGTLEVDSGSTLVLHDGGTLAGAVTGQGTLILRGGPSYTLKSGLALNVSALTIYDSPTINLTQNFAYAGTFYEAGSFSASTLNLAGHLLDFTNSVTFDAPYGVIYLTGSGGEVYIAKGATAAFDSTDLASGMTILNAGALSANYSINLDSDGGSSQSLFSNTSSGVVDLADSGTVFEEGGASGLISNAGVFDKVASTGQSDIYVSLKNTGTLEVDSGSTLVLHDGATLAGKVTGDGTLILRGGPSYTFEAGLVLNVSYLTIYDSPTIDLTQNLTYGGTYYEAGSFSGSTIDLAGHTLTFTDSVTFDAPYGNVYLSGGGEVAIAKGATASLDSTDLASGVTILNAGALSANYDIDLDSDSGSGQSLFSNASTGVVDIGGSGTIFEESGSSGLITNAGTIEKLANSGTGSISVALNNTGTITVDTGSTLALNDGGTLGGAISGAGSLNLQGGAAYTLAATLALNISDFNIINSPTVTLSKSLSYAGSFYESGANSGGSTLDLAGYALTLSGSATFTAPYSVVNLTGGGTVSIAKGAFGSIGETNIAAGVNFTNAGTMTDTGYVYLDSNGGSATSTFTNQAGGLLNIDNTGAVLAENGKSGLLSNAGFIDDLMTSGESDITVSINSTGTLASAGGLLALRDGGAIGGAISGAGEIAIEGGASTLKAAAISAANFDILSSGTTVSAQGNVTDTGAFDLAAGTTLGIASGDIFTLEGTSTISGKLNGAGGLAVSGGTTTVASGATLNPGSLAISGAGAVLAVDESLSYGGAFSEGAGSTLSVASGDTLSLGGKYSVDGTVDGAGVIHASGTVAESGMTLGGTLAWDNYADLTQSGLSSTIGDASGAAAWFYNYASGVFDIADDTGIALGAAKTSGFTNAGLLEKTGGSGKSVISVNIGNNATISATSGVLDFARAVNGTGADKVGSGATLEFDSSVATGQTVSFSGSGGRIALDDLDISGTQYFHGTINGFGTGDTIDVGAPFGSGTTPLFTENQAGTGGTLSLTDGSATASILLTGSYVTGNFVPVSDGANGTMFTYHAVS